MLKIPYVLVHLNGQRYFRYCFSTGLEVIMEYDSNAYSQNVRILNKF
jgi:hypothetical protein